MLGEYNGCNRGSSEVWEDDSAFEPNPHIEQQEKVNVSNFETFNQM
jgi:hypothetical protein